MKIKDLTISDLKSAYDFTLSLLKEFEETANRKGISTSSIPRFKELKESEHDLFTELTNRISTLE